MFVFRCSTCTYVRDDDEEEERIPQERVQLITFDHSRHRGAIINSSLHIFTQPAPCNCKEVRIFHFFLPHSNESTFSMSASSVNTKKKKKKLKIIQATKKLFANSMNFVRWMVVPKGSNILATLHIGTIRMVTLSVGWLCCHRKV